MCRMGFFAGVCRRFMVRGATTAGRGLTRRDASALTDVSLISKLYATCVMWELDAAGFQRSWAPAGTFATAAKPSRTKKPTKHAKPWKKTKSIERPQQAPAWHEPILKNCIYL